MTPSFPPSSFYQPRASTFLVFCQILLPPFLKRIFILAAQKFSLSLSPPAPPTFFLSQQQQQMKNTFLPFSSHLGKRIFLPQYRFSRCLWPTNSFSPLLLTPPLCTPTFSRWLHLVADGQSWFSLSSPPTTLPQSPSRRENPAALFNSSPSFMNFSYLFLTFFLFFDKKVEGVCLVCAGFRSVEGGCMYLYVYIFFFPLLLPGARVNNLMLLPLG